MPDPAVTAGEAAGQKLSPEQLDALAELDPETIRALGQSQGPSATRRGVLAGGTAGVLAAALGVGAMSETARGAAQDSGGEGDLGSTGNPFEGFADGLAMVTQQVSTSTTVTKPIVLYDSAVSSLTLDISSDLEGPSGFAQRVTFIDRTGNADTNNVTVEASDGTTVATIPAENSIFETWWDSGEWVTDRFIPSVDAGEVAIDQVAAVLEWSDGGSNQSIGNGSETKIEWQNAAIDDSDIFSVTLADDEIDVLEAGTYQITGYVTWAAFTSTGRMRIRLYVNGSNTKQVEAGTLVDTSNAFSTPIPSVELNLSANDTLDIRVIQDSGNSEELQTGVGGASLLSQFAVTRTG